MQRHQWQLSHSFNTCPISKANPAFSFESWILWKFSKPPWRATFSAGWPSYSTSVVSPKQRSSELVQWHTQDPECVESYQKWEGSCVCITSFSVCITSLSALSSVLSNLVALCPWVRQIDLRDWPSTGTGQELQLSLSREPFAPNILSFQRD